MSLDTKHFEHSLVIESRALLAKIKLTACPIWRFHYLGAISGYCELVVKLKSHISESVYQQLIEVEDQALAEISHSSTHVRH